MRSRLAFAVISFALMLLNATPASAGRRTFSLDPFGFRRQGAGVTLGSFGTGGITLGAGSGDQFAMGFVIPRPYRTDTPLRIMIHWHTADPNCGIELDPDFVDRSRPGHAATSGAASGGLTPEDSSPVLLAPAFADQGNVKVYLLGPSQGFDQRSGDSILLGFIRNAAASDTCLSDLVVTGVEVEYRTP